MEPDASASENGWERLADEFSRLSALAPETRAAALDALAAYDAAFATELATLLAAGEPGAALEIEHRLLERPLADDALAAGERIGPYQVVRLVGRGGMGEVYLADRVGGSYAQQVAVKLLRAGIYGEAALARFDRERRILARLTHPAVVPLLDGGVSSDGRPYLVLQYVDGQPITADADARRLGVRDRLVRFIGVCRAVQYAHAQLVVHRDLKPSNILVTADGAIRLLDFGIARLLDDDSDGPAVTRRGVGPMTLERAAPEQLRGEPATTATDVWGLGVLLFELLTGQLPLRRVHDGSVDVAAVRMTSGRLKRHMRGDLERIIQHALHADPNRRYAGAAALADDVEALLDGRPVVARPDSWPYRVRRFIGRHRAATAATVVSVAALVTVAVGATLQSRRVAEERDRATAEERRAAAVIDLMAQVLGQTDPRNGQGLTTVSIDELLSHAESLVPSLSPQSDVQGRMLQALGSIRFVRGERPAGLALLERGLSATAALDLTHPVRVGLLIDYADALAKSGRAGVATPLLEPLVAGLRAEPARRGDLARALQALGTAVDGDAGLVLVDEALRLDQQGTPTDDVQIASDLDARANLEFRLGRTDRARAAWRQSLTLLEAAHGSDHPTTMLVLGNLASVLDAPEEADERVRIFERLEAFNERLYGDNSVQAATASNNLGVALVRLRRFVPGEAALRQAADRYERIAGRAHPNTIGALRNVARTLEFQDRYGPALEMFAEITRRLDAARASVPDRAPSVTAEAQVRMRNGQAAVGARLVTRLLADLAALGRAESVAAADAGIVLGRAWLASGRGSDAVGALRAALRVREQLHPPADPRRAEASAELGRALVATGEAVEGRRLIAAALPQLETWPLVHWKDIAAIRDAGAPTAP